MKVACAFCRTHIQVLEEKPKHCPFQSALSLGGRFWASHLYLSCLWFELQKLLTARVHGLTFGSEVPGLLCYVDTQQLSVLGLSRLSQPGPGRRERARKSW